MRYQVETLAGMYTVRDTQTGEGRIMSANLAAITDKCAAMNADKLVKMFTVDGPLYVLQSALDGTKELLVTHNRKGERLTDWNTTKKQRESMGHFGVVHRENLSVSKKAAIEKREAIYRELFPSLYAA